jgi:hypothetical protein
LAQGAADLKPADSEDARYLIYVLAMDVDRNNRYRQYGCKPAEQRRDIGRGINLLGVRQYALSEAML